MTPTPSPTPTPVPLPFADGAHVNIFADNAAGLNGWANIVPGALFTAWAIPTAVCDPVKFTISTVPGGITINVYQYHLQTCTTCAPLPNNGQAISFDTTTGSVWTTTTLDATHFTLLNEDKLCLTRCPGCISATDAGDSVVAQPCSNLPTQVWTITPALEGAEASGNRHPSGLAPP